MIIPTATSMKLKFPEFQSQADATLEFAIEEATRMVDDTWLEKDQTLALMYYAAHVMEVTIARAESGAGGQLIKSETIGRMSISYGNASDQKTASFEDLTSTLYGTRFLDLLKLNHPAVAIV